MILMVSIVLYDDDELTPNLKDDFQSVDKYHSNFFWHNCAEKCHAELLQKVFCLISNKKKICSFITLAVKDLDFINSNNTDIDVDIQLDHIPVLDVPFFDFLENLEPKDIASCMNSFLEFIYKKGRELSQNVGCRYIRAYIPYFPNPDKSNTIGEPILSDPDMLSIFNKFQYKDIVLKEKHKFRRIPDTLTGKKNVIKCILFYLFRDLKISN